MKNWITKIYPEKSNLSNEVFKIIDNENGFSTRGLHIILDIYEADPNVLDRYNELNAIFRAAIKKSNMTLLGAEGHMFDPSGVTLLYLLAESHASIHTYPEQKYASVDFYTCGDKANPEIAIDYILAKIPHGYFRIQRIERGL